MGKLEVTDELREWCASSTMRDMLFILAKRENISYEKALLKFSSTPIYEALFDYETGIWGEGPVYLLSIYDRYVANQEKVG